MAVQVFPWYLTGTLMLNTQCLSRHPKSGKAVNVASLVNVLFVQEGR
jgi:hypothetical protein